MSAHQNPPKRPRLSLQIKTIANGLNLRGSRTVAAAVDQTSPTAFNTLSNVYASAIDRATPVTAINTTQPLKIRTQNLTQGQHGSQPKTQTQTPFGLAYPETPLTAQPLSPAVAAQSVHFPSTMTATPPLSSGPVDENDTRPFSFSAADTAGAPSSSASRSASSQPATTTTTPSAPHPPASASATPAGGPTTRRRAAATAMTLSVPRPSAASSSSSASASRASCIGLPYVRNRSLHSILRNSPLPPPSARTPVSPRRQSLRLAEKAARRVGYESPIERVITTNQYVRSHIDLLAEEDASPASSTASPATATAAEAQERAQAQGPQDDGGGAAVLDVAMAYTGDETRDGGATPGPFEEMRRRMAGLATRTPTSPGGSGGGSPAGVRKRKRRDGGGGSKRRWVWTIGTQDDDLDDREVGGALAAIRAAARAQGDAQACGTPATAPASAPAPAPAATVATTATTPAGDAAPSAVRHAVEAPSPMEVLTPSIEVSDEVDAEAEGAGAGQEDVVMCGSEAGEPVGLRPGDVDVDVDVDVDMVTPTVTRKGHQCYLGPARQESEGLFNSETGTRRDTPIPADLVPAERRG
ncbi:hypothetical protein VSDG_05810 [Cytospora chrysosperma]|uniref:Uncharacterized protein n=1 Tax=Cytospora chrysosperma TaxID=252740 RepID=A0A423VVL2_CYTCH|nr:hypothetical protein VSDG_05810 [Valsa sordida]